MADVQLTITIRDASVTRVVAMLDGYAGKNISYGVSENNNPMMECFDFSLPTKNGLTNKLLGEKVLRCLLLNLVKCFELQKDRFRYTTEEKAIPLPTQNVPDDIIL